MPIQLASLFKDHAVLQRDQTLPVWGWTAPNAKIRVTLAGNEAFCLSDANGDFFARLPALPAGGPHTLTVTQHESGESVSVHDLLVGEVWLASGQSNMNWTLEKCLPLAEEAIATASFPQIRFFEVERITHLGSHRTANGAWKSATPESARQFSAVAFSFARRLHRELGVPVGVVSASWGGTIIQAWTSRSTLSHNPDVADWLAAYESQAWSGNRWETAGKMGADGRIANYPQPPANTGVEQGWQQPAFNDSAWRTMKLPTTWQNAGHGHTGVFWFRRTVEIPASWVGRALKLHLGAADKQDITYVNGVEIGRTGKDHEDRFWDQRRIYDVPAALVTGVKLSIAVRVYSFIYDGGLIGPATAMRLQPADDTRESVALSGDWRAQCEHNLGVVTDTHVPGHGEPNSPYMLFDNMIQPLVPYALRGAIWYQGESNANNHEIYARMLRDLVTDWRRHWGLPRLAFHVVQLPGYKPAEEHQPDSTWARLREAQTSVLELPHTGIAVTLELGDAGDIHPINKIPVGERLAQSALARTYGHAIPPSGPLFERITIGDGAVRCEFLHAGESLLTTDGGAPARFFIAGEDRVFYPAGARIQGHEVVVTHPSVPKPVAVRYAWADNPHGANLAGSSGLPASPFRSDRW